MYILLTAATPFEIQPVTEFLQRHDFTAGGHYYGLLITGIGSMATTYRLMKSIQQKRPAYLIQAGIGGSFSEKLSPGSLAFVKEEISGDLGVEENGVFMDLYDMGLQPAGVNPASTKQLANPYTDDWKHCGLPFEKGVTINEITTRPSRIEQLQQKYGVAVESMEGLAFHYVALEEGIPFIQLRSISNYVGERDKGKWKMKEAIAALNDQLITIIGKGFRFQ
jgi:futalosine hydrolase